MTTERRRAVERGRWGERIATLLLRLKGFRIVARDVRLPVGEIDVIARRGNLLIFTEVKARSTMASAMNSLPTQQRRRIEKAAALYVSRHPALAGCNIRFDLIAVAPARLPRHISDAWRPPS